jgi:hypothetical protein
MVLQRTCTAIKQGGERCRTVPLRDRPFCFWHDPEQAEAATEARRLGGLRRRREGTLQGAYEFDGLGSVLDIRRLLEIAVMDALGLDNSIARARVLIAAALAGARLLEVGELEERVRSLEAALSSRTVANPRRR